jgi:hypothetical protein
MKVKCGNYRCNWIGDSSETLKAPNPFESDGEELTACPVCKEINTYQAACDEPGCREFAGMGTPTLGGYRWTCHKHAPKEIKRGGARIG